MPLTAALTRCHFDPVDPVAGVLQLVRWARTACQARLLTGAALFDGETAALLFSGPMHEVDQVIEALPSSCGVVTRTERVVAPGYTLAQRAAWRDGYAEPDDLALLAARFADEHPAGVIDAFVELLDQAERR